MNRPSAFVDEDNIVSVFLAILKNIENITKLKCSENSMACATHFASESQKTHIFCGITYCSNGTATY